MPQDDESDAQDDMAGTPAQQNPDASGPDADAGEAGVETTDPDSGDDAVESPERPSRRTPAGGAGRHPKMVSTGHPRAIQDAVAAANKIHSAEIRRALRNLPNYNAAYLEAARQAARAMPPLNVRASIPKIAFDRAVLRFNQDLSDTLAQLSRDYSATLRPVLEPAVRDMLDQIQRSLRIDPDILTRFRETAEWFVPENVRGMGIDDLMSCVSVAVSHRLGVFYAVRPDRLAQVLAAADDPGKVEELLGSFDDDDLDFIEGVLGKVAEADGRLGGLVALLMEAAAALRAGYPAASQALSTNVWDTEISNAAGKIGAITYAKKLSREDDLEEGTLFELFQTGVLAPLVKAYVTPNDSELYSRNGTVHGAQPKQFTKGNAARALTIAVGLVAWHAVHGSA